MSENPTKKERAHMLNVPDKYVTEGFSPKSLPLVFSYVVVLVALILLSTQVYSTARTVIKGGIIARFIPSHPSHPSPTPLPAKAQLNCPGLPPVDKSKPTLTFCSPEYLGDVAGPAGAQIILMGKNFPSVPDKWFLLLRTSTLKIETLTPDTLAQCPSDTLKSCLILPAPSLKSMLDAQTSLFSWQWQKPFPSDAQKDYFIVAQVGHQLITSSKSFTLLTSQPPCIGISGNKSNKEAVNLDCTKPQKMSFHPGDTIKIQGENWLLWQAQDQVGYTPNMQIEINAHCLQGSQCSQNVPLFDVVVPTSNNENLNPDGTFSLLLSLPLTIVRGEFVVSAWNIATPPTGIEGKQRTVVTDHTLMFGEQMNQLTIQIKPGPG